MNKILEIIDAKLITSVGGILLAGYLAYGFVNMSTGILVEIKQAILGTNEAIEEMSGVMRENTAVTQSVQTLLTAQLRQAKYDGYAD